MLKVLKGRCTNIYTTKDAIFSLRGYIVLNRTFRGSFDSEKVFSTFILICRAMVLYVKLLPMLSNFKFSGFIKLGHRPF